MTNYPTGAANDSRAPFNETEVKPTKVDVIVYEAATQKMTITETIQYSIMRETIKVFVETEYNRFYADPSDLTLDELENLERACEIVGKTGYAAAVSVYLEKLNS